MSVKKPSYLVLNLRIFLILIFSLIPGLGLTWETSKPPVEIMNTPWAKDVDPNNVLPEYPRPIMQRQNWVNLNGQWQFQEAMPGDALPSGKKLKENILVPFAWESSLSGVRKFLGTQRAWYKRNFEVPKKWQGDRVLLHFGAVDWEAVVYVNGRYVGNHQGGFDAFYFDITDAIVEGKEQELIVWVYDPTNDEGVSYGKQANEKFFKPERYTYSPVSGIWQTVWLESVPADHYITNYQAVPDIDAGVLKVKVDINTQKGEQLQFEARVLDKGKVVGKNTGSVIAVNHLAIPVPKAKLWWPQDPFLYDLEIRLLDKTGKKEIDRVKGYFGMRKISIADYYRNNHGPVKRIMLNNKFIFQMGPLDQGYWPDGLYTAPTDEALKWELEMMKEWGFNMVRKHIKVEPQRWFYWADKLGILVWQDLPSTFKERTESEKTIFETEILNVIKKNWNHPSIINWIVFNEHWGAYDVQRLTENVMALDSSRLITGNSGIDAGEPDIDYEVGHIKDNHRYRPPTNPFATNKRAVVNGEYGAIGYPVEGHLWDPDGPWVHFNYENKEKATAEYEKFIGQLLKYKNKDELSGAVYTQWTDLENELNGLYTYDRKVIKLDKKRVSKANRSLWKDDLKDVKKRRASSYKNNADGGPESISP